MELKIDEFEKDLLIETIQFRLDNEKISVRNQQIKEDLEDLLRKIEENEYL